MHTHTQTCLYLTCKSGLHNLIYYALRTLGVYLLPSTLDLPACQPTYLLGYIWHIPTFSAGRSLHSGRAEFALLMPLRRWYCQVFVMSSAPLECSAHISRAVKSPYPGR